MTSLMRLAAMFVLASASVFAVRAAADYQGVDGYGTSDGYPRSGGTAQQVDPTTYVIVEAEDGETEEVDGETVIVVQEPEPIAVTQEAPPPPRTIVVEQSVPVCVGGIWVDGYWAYSGGQYVWVDGHCVVERVNYVFVHPRWDFYSNLWWFVPGYYRPCGVYVGFGYYRPWQWYPPYYAPYYRGYRPVPVRRAVPRRHTTVHSGRLPYAPGRGVGRRPGYPTGRTSTVERRPSGIPARARPVSRTATAPSRARPVGRTATAPSRGRPVGRNATAPSRTPAVGRTTTAPNRTGPGAAPRAPSRAPSVVRAPRGPTATGQAARPGGSRVNTIRSARSTVRPSGAGPTLTRSAPASRPAGGAVSPPRTNPVRTARPASAGTRQGASRAARAPSNSGARARPSRAGAARGGSRGGFSRPSSGGGFGRASSRGFGGGGRGAPSGRGR